MIPNPGTMPTMDQSTGDDGPEICGQTHPDRDTEIRARHAVCTEPKGHDVPDELGRKTSHSWSRMLFW
jgi:hypothetical protein